MSADNVKTIEVQLPDPDIRHQRDDLSLINSIYDQNSKGHDSPSSLSSSVANPVTDDLTGVVCRFCNTRLVSARNLTRHLQTARYCLQLRDQLSSALFKCPHCNYETTRSISLSRHLKSCSFKFQHNVEERNRKDEALIELKVENRILKSQIEDMRKNSRYSHTNVSNISNTNVSNISNTQNVILNLQLNYSKQVLSPYNALREDFDKILNTHYKMVQFKKGIKGVCSVINDRILGHDGKKWLISYTPAEHTFHRKGQEEAIEIDEKAEMLLKDLMPTIERLAHGHCIEALQSSDDSRIYKLLKEIQNITVEGSNERKECIKAISAQQQCVFEPDA